MAWGGVRSLILTVTMGWLAGVSALPGAVCPWLGWVTAAGDGLETGSDDLLYRRGLPFGDGVAPHGVFLLLPAVSVGRLCPAGGSGVCRWELHLPGLLLALLRNRQQWGLSEVCSDAGRRLCQCVAGGAGIQPVSVAVCGGRFRPPT